MTIFDGLVLRFLRGRQGDNQVALEDLHVAGPGAELVPIDACSREIPRPSARVVTTPVAGKRESVQQEPIVAFTAGQLRMGRAPALLVVDFLVCFADCL